MQHEKLKLGKLKLGRLWFVSDPNYEDIDTALTGLRTASNEHNHKQQINHVFIQI